MKKLTIAICMAFILAMALPMSANAFGGIKAGKEYNFKKGYFLSQQVQVLDRFAYFKKIDKKVWAKDLLVNKMGRAPTAFEVYVVDVMERPDKDIIACIASGNNSKWSNGIDKYLYFYCYEDALE